MTAGSDDVLMNAGGSLTLIGNHIENNRTLTSVPIIIAGATTGRTVASYIYSSGNFYQHVAAGSPIPVQDGSGHFTFSPFLAASSYTVVSFNDYGGPSGAMNPLFSSATLSALVSNQPAGVGVAGTGFLRLGSADALYFRNNANTADILGLSKSAADVVTLGGAAGALVPGTLRTGGFTVATLPPPGTAGRRAYVTDQLGACPALSATFTGGGTVTCSAFDNGAAWVHE